jgi:hypothetical protein
LNEDLDLAVGDGSRTARIAFAGWVRNKIARMYALLHKRVLDLVGLARWKKYLANVNEKKDFVDSVNGWAMNYYANCSGLTILTCDPLQT